MLTKDLLRIDVRDGEARLRVLDVSKEKNLERAKILIDTITDHVGTTRRELDEALKVHTDGGRNFRLMRGLCKLLLDRTQVETTAHVDPGEARMALFERAVSVHPISIDERNELLQHVAEDMACSADELEASLYADLASNQRIIGFDSIEPEALLHRYNLSLAQTALLRSDSLMIAVAHPTAKRLRQLMGYLKFYRLLYSTERLEGGSYVFKVDGPISVVKHSTRYGLALANFLPALVLCEDWTLVAEYQRKAGARRALFKLNSEMGFQSHYRDRGTWTADEETALLARLKELAPPWEVTAASVVLDLAGQSAVVPDFEIRDPKTGRVAWVEIIWQWRKSTLSRRLEQLAEAGQENLILAVCDAKGVEGTQLPKTSATIHTFKSMPNAKKLMKLVSEVAAVS